VQKVDQYESYINSENINDENEEGDQIIFANKVQNEVENCDLFTNSEESEYNEEEDESNVNPNMVNNENQLNSYDVNPVHQMAQGNHDHAENN